MDRRFLTSQLFGETEHLSFHSQFYDEAGVGFSAAPYIFHSWLRWKNFYVLLHHVHSAASRSPIELGQLLVFLKH